MSTKPEYLSYDRLRQEVSDFVAEYEAGEAGPIDIERVVDVQVGLNIVEMTGLLSRFDVDGFLSSDQTTIYVDQGVAAHPNQNRYRFTLAHEIGHWYLHEKVCEEAMAAGLRSIREYVESITEEDRTWFEFQAKSFAGLLLVPKRPLALAVETELKRARALGFVGIDLSNEAHRDRVIERVAKTFSVSTKVILIRGEKDGLW